jgi:hypothetical protein
MTSSDRRITFEGALIRKHGDIWYIEPEDGPSVAVYPLPEHGQWGVTINTEEWEQAVPTSHDDEHIPYLLVEINDGVINDHEPEPAGEAS